MKIYQYSTSGQAYDAIMCEADGIKTGDIVVIKSERVVGLAWAWPIAVTAEHGELHLTNKPISAIADCEITADQIEAACTVARLYGYPLARFSH